jgi:small-conductance mechanosensitive channel
MPELALPSLIRDVVADLQQASVLWEFGVIALALVIAWLVNRFVAPRVRTDYAALRVGASGVQRTLFPLSALFVVLAGRALLRKFHAVHLLDLAVPLLLALAIVRFAVFMLRHVFPYSGLVQRFERLIAGTVWFGLALYITGLLPDLLAFLDEIRIPLGSDSISLLTIINGLIAVTVTLLLALWAGRVVERRLMGATEMDVNVRVVLTKALQAALVVLAVLIALPMVGIDLTALSVFGGALGVGLGLGLQRIASNYVSGFIILLDRSVSLGDVITVDNRQGQVTKMTARYVVVRSLDGTESIIPNETLISSTVISHSFTEHRVRVALPLRISFDGDLPRARQIAVAAAKAQPRVLSDPDPFVLITGLGESGIELELGVFVGDPERGTGRLRTELYEAILQGFKAAGIAVPYPRRDVRLGQDTLTAPSPAQSMG